MLGRDVYSRVLYGARVSLIVGFAVAVLARRDRHAHRPGRRASSAALDACIMRVMDGLMSIPPILLAIALMALTRGSVQNVIIAITIAEIPARLPPGARRRAEPARAAVCRGGHRLRHAGCR